MKTILTGQLRSHSQIARNSSRFAAHHAAWRRGLLAGLALIICAPMARSVTFNDGGIHTVNTDVYKNEGIIVANNTTLIIEAGAVLGGVADQSGRVYAADTSVVTINGGMFGSGGYASGLVEASGAAVVTVNGGSFGGTGNISGAVFGYQNATVTINGGTFGATAWSSGAIEAFGASVITVNGGSFGGASFLYAVQDATLHVRAENLDLTFYNPISGGTLGVTFCSANTQQIPIQINRIASSPTVLLEEVSCATPIELINDLITDVDALPIKGAIRKALEVKLDAALKALESDDSDTACALLADFIELCTSQSGKKIAADDAADLIGAANDIREEVCSP